MPLPTQSGAELQARKRSPAYEHPIDLLKVAMEMCKWNDPDLAQVIRELAASCRQNTTSFETLVMQQNDRCEPFMLQLLQHGNHEVLMVVHRNVKNGWLIKDFVERTDDSIRIHGKDKGVSWGFQQVGACSYVGPFLHAERHGTNGHLRIARDWFYRGDFSHNQMHGMGEYYMGGTEGRHQVGLFIDDIYRGNPAVPALNPPKRVFSLFKKIF